MKITNKKYYIKKPEGYSPCILGNPAHRDKELNVLPNCVGWATGRFNEMAKVGSCKYLGNTNAKYFVNYCKTQGLTLGTVPRKGACMVWNGIGNNAGHVAIVEEVVNSNTVKTSESGWSWTVPYKEMTRTNKNGRWGEGLTHPFLGFIYQAKTVDNGFFPSKGYFAYLDAHENIGKIAEFMYKTFPAYTKKAALGDCFGKNLLASLNEFERRTGLTQSKIIDESLLKKLEEYGFKHD